jgi:hypothetical protein
MAMADELVYERDVAAESPEIWRIEAELTTAHGPLRKIWYSGNWKQAQELAAYPTQQGGRLLSFTCYERKGR